MLPSTPLSASLPNPRRRRRPSDVGGGVAVVGARSPPASPLIATSLECWGSVRCALPSSPLRKSVASTPLKLVEFLIRRDCSPHYIMDTSMDVSIDGILRRDSMEESSMYSTSMLELSQSALDMSQVSGWSAVAYDWNGSFRRQVSQMESDLATSRNNMSDSIDEQTTTKNLAHDIFVERCCTLYNDIQNAIDECEFEEQVPCIVSLDERERRLMEQATALAEGAPDLADIVKLRMSTINRAMEQLKIRHTEGANNRETRDNGTPTLQLRRWLQSINAKTAEFRSELNAAANNFNALQRLRTEYQKVQLQIETEGQPLLKAAKKYIESRPSQPSTESDKKAERAIRNLAQLEQRFCLTWIKSLENLERINSCLQRSQGPTTLDPESASEDEEPSAKRRRTFSTETDLPSILPCFSPRSTVSDAPLIPSSTESECATEDMADVDVLPSLSEPAGRWIHTSGHDVGYSSGENSPHDEKHLLPDSGELAPPESPQFVHRLKSSPTKQFYKTVPLDDDGATDGESARVLTDTEIKLCFEVSDPLSESMIAQVDMLSESVAIDSLPDGDFDAVMAMMNEDPLDANLRSLMEGTQWRELKIKPKREPTSRRSLHSSIRSIDNSREASSEGESDKSSVAESGLHSISSMQRRRRIKKAARSSLPIRCETSSPMASSFAILKQSLTNVGMDESIYVFNEPVKDVMSQSVNATFNGSSRKHTLLKRKMNRNRMHQSLSDHADLFTSFNMNASFPMSSSFTGLGTPLASSTLRRSSGTVMPRRPSIESLASSTSSGTVQENGDVNYEWDEYGDTPPSPPDMSLVDGSPQTASTSSSILDATIIEDDYQAQLPVPDSGSTDDESIETALLDSRQTYFQVRRIINDYDALAPENNDVRKALRQNARENVKRLTAIVAGLPRTPMNNDASDVVEHLQKDWKHTLEELESVSDERDDDEDVIMEEDQAIAKSIQENLKDMKTALSEILVTDARTMGVHDIKSFLNDRQRVCSTLFSRRDNLREIAEHDTNNRFNVDELMTLLTYVDDTLVVLNRSTGDIEVAFGLYQDVGTVDDGLQKLTALLESFVPGKSNLEVLENTISQCEERINALEDICNGLSSQFGEIAAISGKVRPGKDTKYWRQLKASKSEFNALKERCKNLKSAKSTSPKSAKLPAPKSAKSPAPKSANRKKTILPPGSFGLQRRVVAQNRVEPSQTPEATSAAATNESRSFTSRLVGAFRESRLLQALLGFSIFLGAVMFLVHVYADDGPQNNWRRRFGPQLDYVNGPPPS